MSDKKKKRATPEENKTTSEYYKLHTGAVKDLVEANEDNSPEVPEEELRKYRSGPKIRIADPLKAILIKAWFAGSLCFFILWGLSAYIPAYLDLLLVFALALGIVTDILTNNILRYIAKYKGANDRWMMFPKRSYLSFVGNIFYAVVLLVLVNFLYTLINTLLFGQDPKGVLGVGPILFGIFYTAVDLLMLGLKRLLMQIVADAKKKVQNEK